MIQASHISSAYKIMFMIHWPSLLVKSPEFPIFGGQKSPTFHGWKAPGIPEAPRGTAAQRGDAERLCGVLREGPRVAQGAGSAAADGEDAGDLGLGDMGLGVCFTNIDGIIIYYINGIGMLMGYSLDYCYGKYSLWLWNIYIYTWEYMSIVMGDPQ